MSAEQAPLQMPPQYAPRPMGPLLIKERKEFVPEWCPWRMVTESAWRGDREAWDKLATTKVWTGTAEAPEFVVSHGVYVTVAHVLPERRFAIEIDGRVKDTPLFHDQCETKWVQTFAIAGQKQSGSKEAISKPDPVEFVKWGEDPGDHRRRQRIGFDPLAPAPSHAKRRTIEEAEADPVAGPNGRVVASPDGVTGKFDQLPGQLVDADGQPLVQMAGGPVAAGRVETPAERMDTLERLHGRKAISDAELSAGMRKIAEEAGWAASDSRGVREPAPADDDASPSSPPVSSASPDPGPPPALFSSKAQCGRTYEKVSQKRAEQAVRMHARRCRECIGIRDAD